MASKCSICCGKLSFLLHSRSGKKHAEQEVEDHRLRQQSLEASDDGEAAVFQFSGWAFAMPGFTIALSFQDLGMVLSAKRNEQKIFKTLLPRETLTKHTEKLTGKNICLLPSRCYVELEMVRVLPTEKTNGLNEGA
uniref:Uncharacterized protein n=1 Tax=Sphaerodactylus townsendi TaxID=933632 RepID=A0ACB8G562_9SAUR